MIRLLFCTEAPTDADVMRVLVQRIAGRPVVDPQDFRLRLRGYDMALKLAPTFAWHAYHSGMDGALFAIDNDGAPHHEPSHLHMMEKRCRVCALQQAARTNEVLGLPRHGLGPLRFLYAVPVEAIESWLLLAKPDARVDELSRLGGTPSQRRELKHRLYGTAAPDQLLMREVSLPLAEELDLAVLEHRSPSFRHFAAQVRAEFSSPPAAR